MRAKQSDAEFLANLGGVTSETIRGDDRFNTELIEFDFWGSLDSIALVYELEKCLGIKITDETAEKIPNPELKPGLTVSDWVQLVLKATSDLKNR